MKELTDKARDEEVLIENLADAGLCTEEIEAFLTCYRQSRQVAQMQFLNAYRGKLLDAMKENQEKLYCLDYLIRRLREEKS